MPDFCLLLAAALTLPLRALDLPSQPPWSPADFDASGHASPLPPADLPVPEAAAASPVCRVQSPAGEFLGWRVELGLELKDLKDEEREKQLDKLSYEILDAARLPESPETTRRLASLLGQAGKWAPAGTDEDSWTIFVEKDYELWLEYTLDGQAQHKQVGVNLRSITTNPRPKLTASVSGAPPGRSKKSKKGGGGSKSGGSKSSGSGGGGGKSGGGQGGGGSGGGGGRHGGEGKSAGHSGGPHAGSHANGSKGPSDEGESGSGSGLKEDTTPDGAPASSRHAAAVSSNHPAGIAKPRPLAKAAGQRGADRPAGARTENRDSNKSSRPARPTAAGKGKRSEEESPGAEPPFRSPPSSNDLPALKKFSPKPWVFAKRPAPRVPKSSGRKRKTAAAKRSARKALKKRKRPVPTRIARLSFVRDLSL